MFTRASACSFTGHRPEKLPWGENEQDPRCVAAKKQLMEALERAYARGYTHFICGMARGADFYFGEAVLALRERHPEVTLECACPCETQTNGWGLSSRQRHQAILDRCNYETLVQHGYDRGCMMRRNRYMVDRSSHIISLYDGMPTGGTAATLAYAMKQGLTTDIIQV